MTALALRPPREEDIAAIAGLFNATTQAAWGTEDFTEDQFRTWLTSPKLVAERDVRLADNGQALLGYVDVDPQGSGPVRWWSNVRVDPAAETDEVARLLVSWAEERARQGILRVWTASVDEPLKRVFERLGFQLIRHSYRMRIDFQGQGQPEAPRWPEGLTLRTFRSGDERAVYEAHQEAFADSWDFVPEPYQEWAHWLLEREHFDPELWFLALADEGVAGFALCKVSESDATVGFVESLGVRRPWRRRGLGRALLQHAFREFHSRGLAAVALGVDASSLTGADRLYERAGMRIARRTDFYDKELVST